MSAPPVHRALIWAFHDVDGVLDDANARYLAALLEHAQHAVVVVNGALDDAGRRRVAALGAELIVRENHGYDVEAFKAGVAALESRLPELDELVIANSSVFGPLRPLGEMFDRMAAADVDLWGITRHAPAHPDAGTTAPRAERAHIQSYFTAYRASVLRSEAFADYWRSLPPIEGYDDAVRLHELQQTGYFEDHGFRWQVAVDTADLEHLSTNPIIGLSAQLVRERDCPVFKRRMLFLSTEELTVHSDGAATAELWRLLGVLPSVQRDELVAHAIRTMPADRVRRTLQDTVWLDTPAPSDAAQHTPADAAIVIVDGPMAHASVLEWTASAGAELVALVSERGDSPAALAAAAAGARLVHAGARPALLAALDLDTEHLLVLGDDDRPGWAEDARIARAHARAALGSGADALHAAVAAFRDDPALGAIVPPTALGRRLVGSQARVPDARARAALEAAAPGRPLGHPLAPTPGASLWVRRSALEHLERVVTPLRGGRQLDHPTLVSVLVQGLGTIGLRARTGITHAVASTRVELGDSALSAIAAAVGAGAHDTLGDVIARAGGRPLDASIFFDTGGGYRHVGAVQRTFPNGGPMVLEAVVPERTLGIRFDPAEGTGLIVSGIRVEQRGYRIRPVNGSRAGALDLFSTHDPAYDVAGALRAGDTITIRVEHAERIDGSTAALERIERRFGPLGPLGRVRSAGVRVIRKANRMVRSRLR